MLYFSTGMKKPMLKALIFAMLLPVAGCVFFINIRGTFQIDDLDKGINEETDFRFVRQAEDSTYWALFGSEYYGFNDYWVARSKDKKTWEKLFTGEHIYSDEQMRFYIVNGTLKIVEPDIRNRTILIPIDQLDIDSDGDGLTDIEEKRLWTDPSKMDTDGDGIADNLDQNPLVGKKDSLDDRQKLIKLEIEGYLEDVNRNQTIIVEVYRKKDKMEFESYNWRVLCLTGEETRDYWDEFGLRITLIKATPTIEGNTAKVVFDRVKSFRGYSLESTYKKNEKGEWIYVESKVLHY